MKKVNTNNDDAVRALEFRQLERRRYELEERIEPLALEDAERGVLFDEWRNLLTELRVRRRALQAQAARA